MARPRGDFCHQIFHVVGVRVQIFKQGVRGADWEVGHVGLQYVLNFLMGCTNDPGVYMSSVETPCKVTDRLAVAETSHFFQSTLFPSFHDGRVNNDRNE